MRVKELERVLFSGATANGVSTKPFDSVEYQTVTLAVTIAGAFTAGTLKIQGAITDIASNSIPNFGSAQSASNQWGYIQTVNLDTGALVGGSVGLPLTANGTFLLETNANGLSMISAELAGITGSGTVDVKVSGYGQNR